MADPVTLSSPTILRLKRKRQEEPVDALVVNGHKPSEKKARKGEAETGTGTAVAVPTMFRLAETVPSRDFENPARLRETITRLRNMPQENFKMLGSPAQPVSERRHANVQNKLRESKAARYKLVNARRQIPEAYDEDSPFHFLDIEQYGEPNKSKSGSDAKRSREDEVLSDLMPMIREYLKVTEGKDIVEDEYVYDIYCVDHSNVPLSTDHVASLTWDDEDLLMYDEDSDQEVHDDSSEDSNAEDYYQNEYPDASDDEASENYDDYSDEQSENDEDSDSDY
ncbi:hypothetical protein HK104_004473 [Borealophlyctis nickersoniae]|nr:hypothetical protein HK104_004473 [Borealophlyctis nickersoniae]